MKFIKYSKYVPNPAGEMSMEDLVNSLSDYLLQSGFQNPYDFYQLPDQEQTMEALRQAIEDALENGDFLDEEMREQIEELRMEGKLGEMIDELMQRMQQEGFISVDQPFERDPSRPSTVGGQTGESQAQARFEVTDKSLDFLGYKTLRDLLASFGRSSFGRHDTRDMSTGIEANGASKPYEFGDTLNLDITATLAHAIQREGRSEEHTSELQSPCNLVCRLLLATKQLA